MKHLLACLLLAAAALFAGCVDYDEQITLNKDGSGQIEMRMAMDKESYQMMEEMSAGVTQADGPWSSFSREEIESSLKDRDSKAKLLRYSESEEGKDKVWEMAFSFTSFKDLADIGEALDEENEPGETPFTFVEQGDGTWLFTRALDMDEQKAAAPGAGAEPEMTSQMPPGMQESIENLDPEALAAQMQELAKSMEKMAADMEKQQARMEEEGSQRKIRFRATLPGDIVESNATRVEGKTAVWEYSLEELFQMEGKMPALTARIKK